MPTVTTADAPKDTAALIAWLERHDEPCPVCRYQLRGLTEPRCPECAADLTLGVASPGAIVGPLLLAMAACALAVGFDFVQITVLLIISAFGGLGTELRTLLAILLALGIPSAVLGYVIARKRVWWMKQRPKRQWRLAWILFFTIGLTHLALGGGWFVINIISAMAAPPPPVTGAAPPAPAAVQQPAEAPTDSTTEQ